MADAQESLHFLDYWRVICSRKEIVIAISLLVVLAGIAVTYTMPKVFMASTVIAVREEAPDVPVFSRETLRYDPLFLRTQFEIIQSRPIVEEAVRRLNLDQKIGSALGIAASPRAFEKTCDFLSGNMRVQQYRDTNLIEIQILLAKPEDTAHVLVADIANEIAAVFRDERMKVSRKETDQALNALYESYVAHQNRVKEAEKKLAEIRQKHQIDVVGSGLEGPVSLDRMTLTQLENMRIRVQMELAGKEARYKQILGLSKEQLLASAPYLVGDPALATLVGQKRSAEIDLSQLKETHGPNHPDILRRERVITELKNKIGDALNGMKTGVMVDFEAAKAKFKIVENELNAMKASERVAETVGYREFREAQQELEHAQHIRDVLELRYEQEKIETKIPRTIIEVIERATPANPGEFVSPKFILNILLSIIIGLGSGIGLAYFIEYLDTSVKTIEDVEKSMGVPVLGVIPRGVKPLNSEGSESAHAEAYRVLRTNIQFSKKLTDGRTLTCTSGSVGEGKSLTIFNLAYVCAQLGERTLIVDSDLHRPKQHKMMGVSNSVGLTTVLMGEADLADATVATPVPNMWLLPSGRMSSEAHGLLDTWKMRELIGAVREAYDVVFFDAPPIIGVSDATVLAREIDGVLLVVQHRKYPRAVSQRAKSMLENAGANLIGVVLNNINISRDYSYYYYHYSSSQYYSDRREREGA